MMKHLTLRLSSILESITEWTGKIIAWLTLFMVIAVVATLILRDVFEMSAIPLQESITYAHAIVFMLGAAYTLKHEGHVRVDVFYQKFSPRKKALTNLFGFLFLLVPVCVFVYIYCKEYVWFNWELKEGSNSPGGLPYLYLLKTLLILMPISLLIQGLAMALKDIAFLKGWIESPYLDENEAQADNEQGDSHHV